MPIEELDTNKLYKDQYGWLWRYCHQCTEWHRWKEEK